ncbi:MAG: tetratricopeptide repeat protein [Bacteroidota bacterium]|nr:tetratricopeptide repeat protein [Bacteroidota bacterium]
MSRDLRIIAILFFSFLASLSWSSTQSDSLLKQIEASTSDSARIQAVIIYIQEIKSDFPDSALIMLNKAELTASAMQLHLIHASVLHEKGLILFDISEFSAALDHHFQSKQLLDSVADLVGDTNVQRQYLLQLMNIARVFQYTGRYDEANEYFFEVLSFLQNVDPEREIKLLSSFYLKTYFNIGAIYIYKQDYDQAEIYYTKTLNEISKDDKKTYASILNNLGIIAKERGDYQQAFDYQNRALVIRGEIEDYFRMAQSYNNLGTLYALDSNWLEGGKAYTQALQLSQDHNNPFSEIIALYGLSKIYYEMEEYKTGFDYYVDYKELNDSILNQNKLKEIAQLEVKERYRKKLQDARLKHEQLELDKQRQLTLIVLIGSIAVLGFAVLILLYFLQRNKIKREHLIAERNILKHKGLELEKTNLEQELEFRNKELATNVMSLARSNEFIITVTEQLLKSKLNLNKESQAEISRIIREMQSHTNQDIWKDFELRFQQVYNDFYVKLQKKFPNLSTNEKKLCAFLKLNMTTKEISAITYQSVNSIVVARSRLRKKLGLETDKSLISFLEGL